MTNKGFILAENFFKRGFPNLDDEMNYYIIHINPPRDQNDNTKYDYESKQEFSFASDYVLKRIMVNRDTMLSAELLKWFEPGGDTAAKHFGAVSAGLLFEKICLWLAPVAEKTIVPITLNDEQVPLGSVKLPKYRTLPLDWDKSKTPYLKPNLLYQPMISNLESGDAFGLVQIGDDNYMLIVIQVTTAHKHPVKVNGLKTIVSAFPEELRKLIKRKVILFVTPIDGHITTMQPLHSKENKVIKAMNIPKEAKDFEQWLYRHSVTSGNKKKTFLSQKIESNGSSNKIKKVGNIHDTNNNIPK